MHCRPVVRFFIVQSELQWRLNIVWKQDIQLHSVQRIKLPLCTENCYSTNWTLGMNISVHAPLFVFLNNIHTMWITQVCECHLKDEINRMSCNLINKNLLARAPITVQYSTPITHHTQQFQSMLQSHHTPARPLQPCTVYQTVYGTVVDHYLVAYSTRRYRH